MSKAGTALLIVTLFTSRKSCVMKDVCAAATSRCEPTFTKSAYASDFTRQLFQLASVQSKIGTPIVFLVSKMPPASAVRLRVSRGQIPSNHWVTKSCSQHGQQKRTNDLKQIDNSAMSRAIQHCRGSATMIECTLWRRGCNRMCALALLWLDEVSGCFSINNGVHVSQHQSLRIQNSTRHLDSET